MYKEKRKYEKGKYNILEYKLYIFYDYYYKVRVREDKYYYAFLCILISKVYDFYIK